jgi:hypothetical protein
MKKATRIIGYVLLVSGLNVGLAAAQDAAPASSSKFTPATPGVSIPTGIVLTGIRPLLDPPALGFRPVVAPPRPVTGVPRPLILSGWPSLVSPYPGKTGTPPTKPLLGVLPKPGTPFPVAPKPITMTDVNGYDR